MAWVKTPISMSSAMPPSSASTKAARASGRLGSEQPSPPIDEENRDRLTNLLLRADSYRVGDPRR